MTALAHYSSSRLRLAIALVAGLLMLLAVGPGAQAADSPRVAVDDAAVARFAWRAPVGSNQVVFERGLAGSTLGDSQAVSFTNQSILSPEVAVAPDGTATFAWETSAGAIQAVRRFSDGSLGPVHLLVGSNPDLDVDGTRVAVDPAGNATFSWARRNADGDFIVQTRRLEANGTLTATQDISQSGQDASHPRLAVAPGGDVVFVWTRFDATDPFFCCNIVQTRRRAAAAGFSGVQDLSAPGQDAFEADVAVDGDGDATFVWGRGGDGINIIAQTRRRSAAGALSDVKDLSAAGQHVFQPDVAVDADDDAAFAWMRPNGANEVIQSRFRTPDGTFGQTQTISAAGGNAFDASVGMDTAGNTTFAWRRFNGTHNIAQTRRRPAGGSFSSTQNLSLAGASAFDPQLAVAPGGDAVFAWERAGVIQARRRTAAGALGPILDVGT